MKRVRQDKTTEKELPSFIASWLIKLNRGLIRFADFLQKRTNSYSEKKKKLLLLLFITLFAALSVLVLVQSINGKNKMPIVFTRIKTIPVHKEQAPPEIITRTEFLKIQKFKSFIDSLSSTAEGRLVKDSLLRDRPHLMDSVSFLLNSYLEQLKTKKNEK